MFGRYVVLLSFLWWSQLKADDPPSLQIRIDEGDGQAYAIGSRATRGIGVAIIDNAGKPVEGATVSLRLPESGPGGTFSDGSKSEIVTTRADGVANVWGMKWNRQAGAFEVRITATKGTARAGTVVSQNLTETAAPGSVKTGGSSHKWLWIVAAAGAAGAGAAFALRGHSSSSSCSSTVILPQNPCTSTPVSTGVTVIGQPTINLGPP